MRAVVAWSDRIPERDGQKNTVWDLCFRPDGSQLVVAVGTRVLVYDAQDGDLLHSLKGHKDTVYCVEYSKDGQRFASGGADRTIFIWTCEAEGLLKYSHNDSIQKLAYNPVTHQLASCTAGDFGLWSPKQKSVQKHKVASKILCASWTNDGQFLALGMLNGVVTIRDKSGVEKVSIERDAPIWSIQWNPSRDEPFDVLAVGCWDQTLSFYQLSGTPHGRDTVLGFDPCSVSYFSNGEYLVVAGSDKQATLYTNQGVKLTAIGEREDWVWCAKARPKQNFVAVGCNDGTIAVYQLVFSTVHGLYQDRYAYRDTMTDVMVQHLMTEQRVRIKCKDYVKKIAVYRDRLAVQLPDRVVIYELAHDDSFDMHYRVREKIMEALECNLLVVTSLHVILCQERKLQLYNFGGRKEREWVLEAVIRYIKVVGGPAGREGLLVGLKNGTVLKIFVDNPFPIQLIKQRTSIRCLDLSASRRKLAVVDENAQCLVYDLDTKELLFQEPNANSVAWNAEMEDMLCFSGDGLLSIKTGNFPIHQQKLQGFVVGFNGSKIFCLHYVAMQTIDVPQSASLYRYLENQNWGMAYRVACLGVTESDWRHLALAALKSMEFETARKAFIRVRDMQYLELLNRVEKERRPTSNDFEFLAEIMAYEGKYDEAAKLFAKAGQPEKALTMYSDLCMWERAREMAEKCGRDTTDLTRSQGETAIANGDFATAANIFIKAGDYMQAIAICTEHGWLPKLMEMARAVDASRTDVLKACGDHFRTAGAHQFAKEVFEKMNDTKALVELHVEAHEFDEALRLIQEHPGGYDKDVYLAYAEWNAVQGDFEKAQEAYIKAERPDLSEKILQQLTHNAVITKRFQDAGFYFWILSQQCLKSLPDSEADITPAAEATFKSYEQSKRLAGLYNAYHHIHQFVDAPFTSMMPESVFNAARFLLNVVSAGEVPYGISIVYVLYTIAKQGKALEAFKLARMAYDRLGNLKLPAAWADAMDLAVMTIQSRPFSDKEDLLPVCYRCSSVNPVINNANTGDVCVNCGHPFLRSFASFEALPLVQFRPTPDLSEEEAIRLIKENPAPRRGGGGPSDSWEERKTGEVQTLSMADGPPMGGGGGGGDGGDLFTGLLGDVDAITVEPIVVCDRAVLKSLRPADVFIRNYKKAGVPCEFYHNMIPELGIAMCAMCFQFYHMEDFEFEVLKAEKCPFCRSHKDKVGLV